MKELQNSYFFQGVILPERAQLTVNFELGITSVESGQTTTVKVNILLNQVAVWIESEYSWDIYDLRNIVRNFVQNYLNFIGYLKGYAYDLEITRVINQKEKIDVVFGIDIPCIKGLHENLDLDKEISFLKEKTAGENGVFVNRCLNDLVLSMKHADDTGFYCYRAIESLKHHCISIFQLSQLGKDKQWEKFREVSNTNKEDIMLIKKTADPLRHGNIGGSSAEERTKLFIETWGIVDRYLKNV
jgi:hypothetical protein